MRTLTSSLFALAVTIAVGCTVGDPGEPDEADGADEAQLPDETDRFDPDDQGDEVDDGDDGDDGNPTIAAVVPGPTWKMVTLVFRNVDAYVVAPSGVTRRARVAMTAARRDIAVAAAKATDEKFTIWNDGRADATMTIIEVTSPIRRISKMGSIDYWIAPGDVKWALDLYAPKGRYDSVFVMWDAGANGELDWLPGIYNAWGINWAPSDATNGMTYAVVHPETGVGGMIHEWLHGAGGFYRAHGLDVPDPHENDVFGFRGPYNGTWTYWYKALLRGVLIRAGVTVGYSSAIYRSGTPRRWIGGSYSVARPSLAQPVLQAANVMSNGDWVYVQWAPVRRPTHYSTFLMIVNRDGSSTEYVYRYSKPGIDRGTYDYAHYNRTEVCAAARRAGTRVDLGAVRMRFQVWPDRTSSSAATMAVSGTMNCN